MPEYATFHNTIFDRKCSKCKKTQENQYFVQNGKLYKTCNFCRDKAKTRRVDRFRNNLTTVFSSGAYHAGLYNDMQAGLSMYSSAAAVPSSSADYFVEEPEMEPDP